MLLAELPIKQRHKCRESGVLVKLREPNPNGVGDIRVVVSGRIRPGKSAAWAAPPDRVQERSWQGVQLFQARLVAWPLGSGMLSLVCRREYLGD